MLTILVNGQVSGELGAELRQLETVERLDGLHRCDAVFGNLKADGRGQSGYRFLGRDVLDFGTTLQIRTATGGRAGAVLFTGRLLALEAAFPQAAPPTIRVVAEDRLIDLRMTRRTRTFENMSDADVVNRVASEHQLTARTTITGPRHRQLVQLNETDLAFLRERARAIDAQVWVDGSDLHAVMRQGHSQGTVALHYGGELRAFTVKADLERQRTGIVAAGWNADKKQPLRAVALAASIDSELGGRTSGAAILEQTFGVREESLVRTDALSDLEAKQRAESHFRQRARTFVVGHGEAELNPSIRPGAHVDLTGVGALFSGRYYVTESRHVFDRQSGMRTAFVAETPGLGTP
jgi:uncharacterized protein